MRPSQTRHGFIIDLSRSAKRFAPSKKSALTVLRGMATSITIFSLVMGSVFDVAFFSSLSKPNTAEAAYTGKSLRTVEFILGGGAGSAAQQTGMDINNSTPRASDIDVYAGSAWNTTKGTAGTKTLTIPGSGIHVLSAYVDFASHIASAANVTDIELSLDVNKGPAPGVNFGLDPVTEGAGVWNANSSVTQMITAKGDATGLLQGISDSDWNSGAVTVVGMASVKGPLWGMSSMKLVVTYEEDYSAASHTALKTVRFPLLSTAAGASGSHTGDCAAASTCSFQYTLDAPDLATTSDIVDAWFEVNYVDDAVATTTIGINGGAAGVAHKVNEAVADNHEHFIIYRPVIGSPNLATSTNQQLDVTVAGTAVGALAAELVVTYKYSTGATTQVETVQYFMGQQLSAPGAAASSTYNVTATIQNTGLRVGRVWFRYRAPIQNTLSFTATAKIGSSASSTYKVRATNGATDATGVTNYLFDMGSATTSWSGTQTALITSFAEDSATGDAPASVEAYITFYWTGSSGGTQTKTGKFIVGSSKTAQADATASAYTHFPYTITIPETVTRTLRSSYSRTAYHHSKASAITTGTITVNANGSGPVTFTENNTDLDAYRGMYFMLATTTDLTVDSAMTKSNYELFINLRGSVATNEVYAYDTEYVITYDAALGEYTPSVPSLDVLHWRWRFDNGTESGASWVTSEDATSTALTLIGDRLRLRFLLKNTGTASATNYSYGLEHASSSCALWLPIPITQGSQHWMTDVSSYVIDRSVTTNVGSGLTDPTGSFVAGSLQAYSSTTAAHTLAPGEFSELEYTIRPTNYAATGVPYCFRLTNDGSTANFVYTTRPALIISSSTYSFAGGGGGSTEASGSGPLIQGGSSGGGSTGGGESGNGAGSAGGTIAIDASSPVRFTGAPAQGVDITSASFTPPNNSLLVVAVSSDTAAADTVTVSVSDSTGGLSWVNRVQRDYTDNSPNNSGHVSLWTAAVTTGQSMTVSVRRTAGGGSYRMSVKVYVVTGADTTSLGTTGKGGSGTSNITPNAYVSTVNNSRGFGAATNWSFTTGSDPSSSDTGDGATYAGLIQSLSLYKSSNTPTAGSTVTMNFNANDGGTVQWNWVALEVKPASGTIPTQGGRSGGGSNSE